MGTEQDAEDSYYEFKRGTAEEQDVNLTRATRFPGDVFWRLSKYLNAQGHETQAESSKQKSWKWPILLVGALVALAIATIVTLSLGAPYLRKSSKTKVLIQEDFFNISDPALQAYVLNLPQRDPGLDEDTGIRFDNPFLGITVSRNTFSSGTGRSTTLTLAGAFTVADITGMNSELRKSRFSAAVEFSLNNGNKYFLCLDEVPTSSYVHLAQHLCGAATTTGTIQLVYGTDSSLVAAAGKQAARGIYECTSPTSCTIKTCATCTCKEVISATCVMNSRPVARAIRGRYSEEGFLQLFLEKKWGYVCVHHYLLGADLVCNTLSSRKRSGFARFTEMKQQTCDTAPREMHHLDIHINCPRDATSLSDCIFENKPCSGIYVWIQCEPFINSAAVLNSTTCTPNSEFVFPPWGNISAPGCDFETDTCGYNITGTGSAGYSISTNGHTGWFRHQGANTSVLTGPRCTGYTPDKNRYFLLFDGSSPRSPTSKAEAASPVFDTTGMCVKFRFNVNGDAGGKLKVVLRTTAGVETILFEITSQVYGVWYWQSKLITLTVSEMAQLVFIAERGLGFRCDVAIDDIEIGPCTDANFASACSNGETPCGSNDRCFPLGKDCDNEVTCEDAEETGSMCMGANDTHTCMNNVKIPLVYKCDGRDSCCDSGNPLTDESGCSGCLSYETSCNNNGLCFQAIQQCDKVNDCGNWFDETNCTDCGFKCDDNTCLPDPLMKCDGNEDCADMSDESSSMCSSTSEDFSSASLTGAVTSNMESDATGGFKPLTEDSSTYTNAAFKTSVADAWGYMTMPAQAGGMVWCVCIRIAGMKDLVSAAFIQISTRTAILHTWAPLELSTPQDGVWREFKIQFEISYNSALVRVQFALRNVFIDDYSITSGPCNSTLALPAITAQGITLPVVTQPIGGTSCDFTTGTCDLDLTSFYYYSSTLPIFDRITLSKTRRYGRLGLYFNSKALHVSVYVTGFTQEMVNAVCKMRGYSTGTAYGSAAVGFGTSGGDCIERIFCPSPLERFFDCFYEKITAAAQCDRSKEIAIICSDPIITDAEINSVSGQSFISTLNERSSSILRAGITSSVQCVQFTYKMPDLGWIYVGGVSSSAHTPFAVSPFQTWGAVFTTTTKTGEWLTVQAPISSAGQVLLVAMAQSGKTIQLTNVTLMTTACTMTHAFDQKKEVLCANMRQSYNILRRCDGIVECDDGSDEAKSLCNKTALCESTVPAQLPACENWTIDGPDPNKPCTTACSSTTTPDPDGVTGYPWCMTGTGATEWGRCNTQQYAIQGNSPQAAVCPPFFLYNNVRYEGCTLVDNPKPWCSLNTGYSGRWGVCGGCPMLPTKRKTTTGLDCVIPFTRDGITFYDCTNYDSQIQWCSLTANYNTGLRWGECAKYEPVGCQVRTVGGNSDGSPCVFPFIFNGVSYDRCLPWNRRLWCSLDAVYSGRWGYCNGCPNPDPFFVKTIVGYGTRPDRQCAFPFYYNGVWYHDCTTRDSGVPWCSLTHNYHLVNGWGACGSYSAQPYTRTAVCLDSMKSFDDGTLMGGTQAATHPVKWLHTANVTKTRVTSPRGGAGKRTMNYLHYADIPEVYGKVVDFSTSEQAGGYIYADMSDSSVTAGQYGDIRFGTNMATATCVHFCYHMVGKHVGSLHVIFNDNRVVGILDGEQVDPKSDYSAPYHLADNWRCARIEPGGWIYFVTFRAHKGKGAEGDMAIDEVHFLESCHLKTFWCPKGYRSCNDGVCIRESQWCNCRRQCLNNADEQSCPSRPGCGSHEFDCGGGCCVPLSAKCDGHRDCPGNQDEANCNVITAPTSSSMGNVLVTSTGEYYSESDRCNGKVDTFSGEDEVNCTCNSTQFSCGPYCIPYSKTCDKVKDCPNNEDEMLSCPPCPRDQFTCDDQTCVPIASLCNGTFECADKSDEPAHQCAKNCSFSMANLPSQYSSLVVGTPPTVVAYGETYKLELTCNGTWWSKRTSYKMRRWLHFECMDSGEALGPAATMDIVCIPDIKSSLLPCCVKHWTDPVVFKECDYVNVSTSLSPFGTDGYPYIKIKGKMVRNLLLWKNGFVSETVVTKKPAPTNYTFLDKDNIKCYRDVFSVLAIDLDATDQGFVFYDQYNKPKFNDKFFEALKNATCPVFPGGCTGAVGSMWDPTYAAVFTFHNLKDKNGNTFSAQLAFVTDGNSTVVLFRYCNNPGVSSSNELGMLLMTADFLRPDQLATSGDLTAHGTHGTNGDYLAEVADFVTKSKPNTIVDFGSTAGDTSVELKSFTGTVIQTAVSMILFGYQITEAALVPGGARIAFGTAGTTYDTNATCVAADSPTQQVTFTAVNTAFSVASSSGFVHYRYTTNAADLAKIKAEVCAVQTLINCATWNPTGAFIVTYQGIMIDDGDVDFEGFGNTFQMIIVTDGTSTFGIVHYALMLEYCDYRGCIEYSGARLKAGFLRELRPGLENNKTTLFNSQFNKNASTNGAYVVSFIGFPCPVNNGTLSNFTLESGYPNPLLTLGSYAFRFLCNGGKGSPFDAKMGVPGPGRVLNPWTINCTADKQGLPINFDEELDGFECLKSLYFFGSELGSAILSFATNFTSQSLSAPVTVKGISRSTFSVSDTGALSTQTGNLPAASCLPLRGTVQTDLYDLFILFGVPFSSPQIFFDAFSAGSNTLHNEILARGKEEICAHLNMTVMTCAFNPTQGFVMTVYKSVTTAPATPNFVLTGQLVFFHDSSKNETYVLYIYNQYSNSTNPSCKSRIGMLAKTADLFQVPEDPHMKTNMGQMGQHLVEIGNDATYYMPENFYSPYPNNILDNALGAQHGTYQLTNGPLRIFDYTFSEFSISDNMAAMVFGGTDVGSMCHDLPISNTAVEAFIMMVNWDVDFRANTRTYIGDTTDPATVKHFSDLVVAQNPSIVPGWQANRVVTHSILGIDTDGADTYELSASWQASIVTDGSRPYFVGSYGLDMSYNRQGSCGQKFRGAVVNQRIARYIDTDPTNTPVTALNIWDSQYRSDVGRVGTWSISLDGEPCNISTWLPPGFAGVNSFPSTLDVTESFVQTFTCTGGSGIPFDKVMGLSTAGGIKMNNQTLVCTPAIQGTVIGFNVSNGFATDLTRFSCLPFCYCCSEAGTARLPTAEFASNMGYVDRSLSSGSNNATVVIKGETFSTVRIYDNGVVSFRQISQYPNSSCFAFMEHQPETVDMVPVFGVLTGNFDAGSGGVFMDQYSSSSSDSFVINELTSLSSLVTQYGGVSSFSATYALVISYIDYVAAAPASTGMRILPAVPIVAEVTPTPQNHSAQLVIVTDGSDTFAIWKFHQYTQSKGAASCPNQLGMLAQSGDFFDIWSMVSNGNTPQNHGNAGAGRYIVQIGKREANIAPPYFHPFGPAQGDEKIDIASMSGEVDVTERAISPPFSLHAYNYTKLLIYTNGVVAFTLGNLTVPTFDACSDNSQLANAPKQTTYFRLFATNLTSVDSYGAIYYRHVDVNNTSEITQLLALFAMNNVSITTPVRMIVITFHGIRIAGRQQSVSFQLILLAEDGLITKALFILGPVTEYLHHNCLSSLESIVNRDKNRTVSVLTREVIADYQKNDRFHGIDAVGHDCPLDSSTSHLSPFGTSHSFNPTLPVATNQQYDVTCPGGWVYDYNKSNTGSGRAANPQEVQCPPYVQGETRTLPAIGEFVCLQTVYQCCGGNSLDLSTFTNNDVLRQSITMSNGFKFDGEKEDFIIIGKTGFLTVEAKVLTNNLPSPKCVNTTDHKMTEYLNYISLFGQDFNYTDAGNIFFEEFTNPSGMPTPSSIVTALFTQVSTDVAVRKGSAFTPDYIMLISYLGVKDPVNGQRQNGQVAIAYDGSETYFILLYDDYNITDTANCTHHIGLRTKSANAMDLDRNTVLTNTNYGGRQGTYIWENREYLTQSEGVGYNMFNFSNPDITEIYQRNNPTSTVMDDTVIKYSISTLFGSSITTFNTFDFDFTHIGVGQGMIYFGDASVGTALFPESYCNKQGQGYTNITHIMLMGHDQNPQISPGKLTIKVLQSGNPLLGLLKSYVCPWAGAEYCDSSGGVMPFEPTHGLVITYQGLTGIDGEKYANTYQAVFGTNGTASFAVFIYSLITDYMGPDCFEWTGVNPKNKPLYRTTVDYNNGTFSRQQYFDLPFFTNCPTCPNKTGVYMFSLDGHSCTWDQVLLGNFSAQAGCCDARVRTTESISIMYSCIPAAGNGFGYIHKYSGIDQNPGNDTLTCTPDTQGETLSLSSISGNSPNFPYVCLHNFFSTCCHASSATNLGTGGFTNGWHTISLPTGIIIKGTTYTTAMLSNTGFLFFNDTANISPPTCYNFTHLDNRKLIPAFSLFSEPLIFGSGEADANSGRIYVEHLTTIPSEIAMTATAVPNPTYTLLISIVEAPIGSTSGQRQSGQLAIVTNGTETEAIFKYAKYTSTQNECKIGAIFETADVLDIKADVEKRFASVADTTHHISIGPKITNTEPPNLIPFLSHTKIPYYMAGDPTKGLNDDRDIQVTLSSPYAIFGQQMGVLSVTDNGYISFGPNVNTAYPDQFCISRTSGYQNVAYLMAMNYDFKPEKSTGALYHSETTSSTILIELRIEVCAWTGVTITNCNSTFNPTKAVIVTLAGLNAFDEPGFGNTFQMIVVTDAANGFTFGIIKYGVILGYRGDVDCEEWRGAKFNSLINEIGANPSTHDGIYAAQHYTNAKTIGTFVVNMYIVVPQTSPNCTFEAQNICSWVQDTNDDKNWNVRSGGTPSSGTGPSSAFAGSYYIYIETTSGSNGDQSKITLDHSFTGDVCIEMQTHMYGSDINTLQIFTRSGSTDTVVHSVTGDQGNQWIKRRFTINNVNPSMKIGINGIKGPSYQGDISIDDLTVVNNAC